MRRATGEIPDLHPTPFFQPGVTHMAGKKQIDELPPEGPTRSSVYELLAGLMNSRQRYERDEVIAEHPDVYKASQAVEKREKELQRDSTLLRLTDAKDKIVREVKAKMALHYAEALKVRREFEAKGLTEDVKKKLAALVKLVNGS